MINNKRILAVVPARGGSKGIPMKNLQPINGVPLVAQVGRVLAELPEVDRAVVSTDHDLRVSPYRLRRGVTDFD